MTFLFTDIEGSTRLWEQYSGPMKAAVARHDELLHNVVLEHAGRVIKTTGDGLHAVFIQASDGMAATLDAQRALAGEAWPGLPSPLRVRMGLRTGEAELREGDYYGTTVNRAARLMSIAAGGQILLSATTAELAREQLPEGASLRDLGEHRLKDLAQPEQVFQLTGSGLPADFPPLKSLDAFPNNLPVQLTSFVGREREVAEVKRLLATTRLLTLTGPGGTGKTRLSLHASAEALESFAGGIWLIELAPLADPALIAQAAAVALGVREGGGRTLLEALIDYLRRKQILLILDNCEHLVEACSRFVEALLRACLKLKVLASSREALGIAGETAFRVPSLALPEADCAMPDALARSESVQLFVERAQAHLNGFAVTEANAGAIAQICRRLDGIPLALELAAARVKLLKPEQIAARLDDRFRLLTGGSRTALPRQQTLRAMMDWSWELLPEPERVFLRRLSVFAGGWTLEAAEAVAADASAGVDALDLLGQLVNKSLVTMEADQSSTARYRLLETIRQYSRDKLFEAGADEGSGARNRHLSFYLAFAEEAAPKLTGPEMIDILDKLGAEQDNFRAALVWSLSADPLAALRMTAALTGFRGSRLSVTEAYALTQLALTATEARHWEGEAAKTYLAAKAWTVIVAASMLMAMGENQKAMFMIEGGIALARQIGASRTLAMGLGIGATITGFLGKLDLAGAWAEESNTLALQDGDAYALTMMAGVRGFLALVANQRVDAHEMEEIIRLARASGNPQAMAMAYRNVGRLTALGGNLAEAFLFHEKSGQLFLRVRDRSSYNSCRSEMGHILRWQGRNTEAAVRYSETIRVWSELGQRAAVARELESFALIAVAQGQSERAGRLFGAAEALRGANGSPMLPSERREYDEGLARLRGQMDEAALTLAWAAGRAMDMDQAIDFAAPR